MISRRQLFGILGAAGAVTASELLLPHRTIFLPPRGGWPRWSLGEIFVSRADLSYYADGIAAGRFSYDDTTQMMTLLQLDIGHVNGKFHSKTGRVYDWNDVESLPYEDRVKDYFSDKHLRTGSISNRAKIDDALDRPPPARLGRDAQIKKWSSPVANLPHSNYPKDEIENWGPPETIAALKAEAIASGIPLIPGTYVIDTAEWHKSDHYKQWQALLA